MKYVRLFIYTLLGAIFLLSSSMVSAHSRWLVPSHTIISSDKAVDITVDMSISNELFNPDIAVGGIKLSNEKASEYSKTQPAIQLDVIGPKDLENKASLIDLGRKSVASVNIPKDGTYILSLTQSPIYFTAYLDEKQRPGRAFGPYDVVKSKLPAGHTGVEQYLVNSRMLGFTTMNDLSSVNANLQKMSGLSMMLKSHPNELFVDEALKFNVLMDGKVKSSDISLHIVKEGTRFRDDRGVIDLKKNAEGLYEYKWQEPGRYLLEIEYTQSDPDSEKNNDKIVKKNMHLLFVTFEVYAQ